ncbi:MAG: hypothetical protein R6V46_00500, partial [Desulfatiglandaceae bacterium]
CNAIVARCDGEARAAADAVDSALAAGQDPGPLAGAPPHAICQELRLPYGVRACGRPVHAEYYSVAVPIILKRPVGAGADVYAYFVVSCGPADPP